MELYVGLDLPRFCSGHLIASYAIKEDGHGIETKRRVPA